VCIKCFQGFIDCRRFICSWIIHFKGWVLLLTSLWNLQTIGNIWNNSFQVAILFFAVPQNVKIRHKYLKMLWNAPAYIFTPFHIILTSFSLLVHQDISVPGYQWFDSVYVLEGWSLISCYTSKYPLAYEIVIFLYWKKSNPFEGLHML
jgi:hypothetical protein